MRQGRHSRHKGDWGTEPSRSAERSAAVVAEERDPTRNAPGRKDKAYCKPARGPHVPVAVKRLIHGKIGTCSWAASWCVKAQGFRQTWLCYHEESCEACGKWFRWLVGADCPDWRPVTAGEAREISELIAERTTLRESRVPRKPAVAGPQGYRRRKA